MIMPKKITPRHFNIENSKICLNKNFTERNNLNDISVKNFIRQICIRSGVSEDNFIYKDFISWNKITFVIESNLASRMFKTYKEKEFLEKFLEKFSDNLYWEGLSEKMIFSDSNIHKFKNKINWDIFIKRNLKTKISDKIILKYRLLGMINEEMLKERKRNMEIKRAIKAIDQYFTGSQKKII